MPKRMKIKSRKALTLTRPVTDLSKAATYLRRLGIVLMPFKGRSMRSTLSDFRLMKPPMCSNPNCKSAETTIKKSMAFHPSLKYVFLPKMKPRAIILIAASIVNKIEKTSDS